MSREQVAIVGGGLAGLQAARLLQAADVDFVLFEARGRLGGRILTTDAHGTPCADGFDLGPSWFWPQMQPAIGELVEELGLSAFAQTSEGDVLFERMLREGPRRYRGYPQEPQSMRITGGMAALVWALARDLPAERLLLNRRVTALTLADDAVTLTLAHGSQAPETYTVPQVIAALPPRLLEANMTFTPALQAETARRWRETATWMAPHAKFHALYPRPFWRDAGLCGTAQSMAGPMPEMHDATTASGQAALFGFIGIPASARAKLGREALRTACIEQFARLFGMEARTPTATIIKDWAADALTATAADADTSAHPAPDSNTPWVDGPWQQHLVLAGSETSPSEPGYLAGAVTATNLAAREILARLRKSNRHG